MVSLTPKDTQRLKKAGLGKQIEYPKEGEDPRTLFLKMKPGGFCVNLNKDYLCDVYSKRPMMCRAYPFMLTPGFENNLVVDISLRCPFVNLESEPKVKKEDIESVNNLFKENVAQMINYSLKYRNTLAEHLKISYAPAFLPRKRNIEFMDQAIDIIRQVKEPSDMMGIITSWADNVTQASQQIIIKRDGGNIDIKDQDREIIGNIQTPEDPNKHKPSPEIWKTMFKDINNNPFSLIDNRIKWGRVSIGKAVKVNKKTYGWNEFENLHYSPKAVEVMLDYMKMMVRRTNFNVCAAKIAQYIVDYQNSTAVEYDIECMLFTNSMVTHLDPYARLLSRVHNHDQIEEKDMRMAIANIDSTFLTALGNGTLTRMMIEKLDESVKLPN